MAAKPNFVTSISIVAIIFSIVAILFALFLELSPIVNADNLSNQSR